jgi:predicted dehydrogenase
MTTQGQPGERPLRVGICGSGITTVHIKGYQKVPGVEVVAIAGPDVARCRQVAERYGIPRVFAAYHDMLALGLDAVSIAVPNAFHAPIALDALAAGCHVLCEKPLAATADDAARMVEAARASERMLMVAFNRRYLPTSLALKRLVDAGTLGPIYHASATWLRRSGIPGFGRWFTTKTLSGGGALIDVGVHILDLALHMMGYPEPVSVSGSTHAQFGPRRKGLMSYGGPIDDLAAATCDVEDFAAGFVRFVGGATLVVESSWAAHQAQWESVVLTLYGRDGGARLTHSGGEPHTLRVFTDVDGEVVETAPVIDDDSATSDYDREIAAFVGAIRAGTPSPVPAEQGLTVMRLIDALYRSAKTGRQIDPSCPGESAAAVA